MDRPKGQKEKRTKGQKCKRSKGQKDKRTKGQKDTRTQGQKDKRTKGQKDKRTKGQKDKRPAKAINCCWKLPTLVYSSNSQTLGIITSEIFYSTGPRHLIFDQSYDAIYQMTVCSKEPIAEMY